MYNLIIIDDEEEVRSGIIEKLEWSELGYKIVGEAENGIDGLEIIEKTNPDVVITDIKMPYMDGLTLVKRAKENYPTIQFIILTGFDEFEYAQTAIKYDVIEYVLKPVSSKELIQILNKVKNKLDEEMAYINDLKKLKSYYKKSLPILREKFLSTLMTSKLSKKEIIEKCQEYSIDVSKEKYIVSIVSSDKETIKGFKLPQDKELVKFSIYNIGNEIIKKYQSGIIFICNDDLVLLLSSNNKADYNKDKVFNILEEVRQTIYRFLQFTVTIGIGSMCTDISNISRSYENARSALDYKLILGGNRLIYIDDMEPECLKTIIFDEMKERLLINSIKIGTEEEITDVIEKLLFDVVDVTMLFEDYQIYLLEILTTILKVARNLEVDLSLLFGKNFNLFSEIHKFNSIEEIKDWLISICIKIRTTISKSRIDSYQLFVQKAKDFIAKNYNDDCLTIDKVCQYLHISSTYFSTIFKKETSTTFVNYLTDLRMDKAKNLLRTTDLKSYQICELVGFSEPNYFSYCFKKNVGLSPTRYRKSS